MGQEYLLIESMKVIEENKYILGYKRILKCWQDNIHNINRKMKDCQKNILKEHVR